MVLRRLQLLLGSLRLPNGRHGDDMELKGHYFPITSSTSSIFIVILSVAAAASTAGALLLLLSGSSLQAVTASGCALTPSLCYHTVHVPSPLAVADERPLHAMYDEAMKAAVSTLTVPVPVIGGIDSNINSFLNTTASGTTTTSSKASNGSSSADTQAEGLVLPVPNSQAPSDDATAVAPTGSQLGSLAASMMSSCRATSAPGMRLRGGRFLMLAQTWEQLSQTKLHMLEAMALAKLTNRTLVLTRVGNSSVAYRQALPFCTYFDTDVVGEAAPWVTQDWLEGEVKREGNKLTTRSLLLVHDTGDQPCDGTRWVHFDKDRTIFTRDVDERGQRRVDCVSVPGGGSTRKTREELLLGAANKRGVRGAELLLLHRRTHRYFLQHDKIRVRAT